MYKESIQDKIVQESYQRELQANLSAFKEGEKLFKDTIETQKAKIDQQYRQRLKSITGQKKIHRSALINKQQMKKATIKYKMCEQVFAEVLKQIKKRIEEDQNQYCLILIKFIVEGALRMFEPQLTIRCLPQHWEIVKRVIPDAIVSFQDVMENQAGRSFAVVLKLNQKDPLRQRNLDSEFSKQNQEEECIGGIILTDISGNITYKNTIDTRVNILREICLPDLRQSLWPSKNL